MAALRRVVVVPHSGKPEAEKVGRDLAGVLESQGVAVELWDGLPAVSQGDADQGGVRDSPGKERYDAAIVLGGDGALLRAARAFAPVRTPILGVNLGHLGFLTELEIPDVDDAIGKLVQGSYTIEERMMLEASVLRSDKEVARYLALNDAVVARGTFARIIRMETWVAGEYIATFPADGLIASTPTGSTAYSLSAGGPIINPCLDCIIVTPICPHTLGARSFVVRPEEVVRIHLEAAHNQVMLTVDGQEGFELLSGDEILAERSSCRARFIKLRGRPFYEILRTRLAKG